MKARFTMGAVVAAVATVIAIASLPPLEDPKTGPTPTAMGADTKKEAPRCKFTSGQVVGLKSGGPTMTVSTCDHDKNIWVKWFDKDGHPQTNYYKGHMLRKMN